MKNEIANEEFRFYETEDDMIDVEHDEALYFDEPDSDEGLFEQRWS